jgi:hypothetical protein
MHEKKKLENAQRNQLKVFTKLRLSQRRTPQWRPQNPMRQVRHSSIRGARSVKSARMQRLVCCSSPIRKKRPSIRPPPPVLRRSSLFSSDSFAPSCRRARKMFSELGCGGGWAVTECRNLACHLARVHWVTKLNGVQGSLQAQRTIDMDISSAH